jgi:uroporphyrinogen-III synthase
MWSRMSNDRHLWITRPAMDGERMAVQARGQGLTPWQMPAMDIFWLMPDKVGLRALTHANVVIVTSRHALTSLEKANITLPTAAIWFAIGQATAAALAERGIAASVPTQTDSEGLLHEILAQTQSGQQLAILKGEGGRTLLSERLHSRGLLVTELPLYRRVCMSFDEGMVDTFLKQEKRVLSVASAETLTCVLKGLTQTQAKQLIDLPLVVMSARVAEFAQAKGWRGEIVVASESSSAGLIDAAKRVGF